MRADADLHSALVRVLREAAEDVPGARLADLIPALSCDFASAMGLGYLVGDAAQRLRTAPRMKTAEIRMLVHAVLEESLPTQTVPSLMSKIELRLADEERRRQGKL